MSLLESARGATTLSPEQFEDHRVDDGQFSIANASDAWTPRTERASGAPQITPEMAFMPFTRFALENHVELDTRHSLGLSRAWGYARHDSEFNPGGGRCNASTTSMSCNGDSRPLAYRGANADVPNPYNTQARVNGNPITTQYFAPSEPQVQSPEAFRYLNNAVLDNSVATLPVSYQKGTEVATSIPRLNDGTIKNLESGLEKTKPVDWRDNSLDAFVESVETDKPMVVVFGDDTSSLFNRQLQEMKSDKDHLMARLSQRAVFVVGKPTEDEYARRMASHLKLTDYPTISVIAPRTDQLTETYRMEGYFQVADVYKDLDKVLPPAKKNQQKPLAPTTLA